MIHILYDGDVLLRAMFSTKLCPEIAVQSMLGRLKNEINKARKHFNDFSRTKPKVYFCISLNRGFRDQLFPYYKSQRGAVSGHWQQFKEDCIKYLRAFRVPIYASNVIECDDIISIMASNLIEDKTNNVYIISPDKDFLQIPFVTIHRKKYPKGTETVTTTIKSSMRELAGQMLLGDKIDNIAGIPGCGKVTMNKWLDEHGDFNTLKEVYTWCKEIYRKHGMLSFYPQNIILLSLIRKYNCSLEELYSVIEEDPNDPKLKRNETYLIPWIKKVEQHMNKIAQFTKEKYERKGKLP